MKTRTLVDTFLKRYEAALCGGDLNGIVACWQVPALVLSDQGASDLGSEKQIRDFFSASLAAYHQHGLQATKLESFTVTELSQRVLTVVVTWSDLDAAAAQRSHERSYYLLRLDEAGQPRIRVAAAFPLP